MIRHTGTHDRKLRLRTRASAASASAVRPDLQTFLATAYLLEKNRRPLSTDADAAGSAQLFSSLASLLRQVADPECDLDQILASVAQQAKALTPADAAAVALVDRERVLCRARAGPVAPAIGTPINLESSFTGQSFRTREVLHCDDTEVDPRVNRATCRVAGIRSILVVPIERQRQSIGIVEVLSASPTRFGTSQIRILELLACVVADAVGARDVELPHPPEPVTAKSEVAQAATMSAAAASASAPGRREANPPTSEPRKPEQQLVVVRRTRSRAVLQGVLILSALSVSFATAVFLSLERRTGEALFPEPMPAAATASASTPIPIAEPVQMAATGPGILQRVRYNLRPDFSTVEIGLSGPVKVKTEHLTNPERIYFDLAETRIASELIDNLRMKAIPIGGRLLSRVRIAQKSEDLARVVIDLNCACEYSYVMSQSPPFRLVLEIHAIAKGAGTGTEPGSVAAPAPGAVPTSVIKPEP